MADVLAARRKSLSKDFIDDFEGMTEGPISVEQLEEAREAMIFELVGKMPAEHRDFLISFKEGKPPSSTTSSQAEMMYRAMAAGS